MAILQVFCTFFRVELYSHWLFWAFFSFNPVEAWEMVAHFWANSLRFSLFKNCFWRYETQKSLPQYKIVTFYIWFIIRKLKLPKAWNHYSWSFIFFSLCFFWITNCCNNFHSIDDFCLQSIWRNEKTPIFRPNYYPILSYFSKKHFLSFTRFRLLKKVTSCFSHVNFRRNFFFRVYFKTNGCLSKPL